jgi:hypothetical protein
MGLQVFVLTHFCSREPASTSLENALKDAASRGKFCLCAAFAIEVLLISDLKLLQPTSLRAGQCIQVLSGKKFNLCVAGQH